MPYFDTSTATGRSAAAAVGANTLGTKLPSTYISNGQLYYSATGQPVSQDTPNIDAMWASAADEDARRYDQNYGLQASATASENAARAAQVQQAKRALAENRRQFDQSFGQRQSEFNTNTGVDLLKYGGSLRGPLDAFQGASFARGVQTGGLAPYLLGLSTTGTTNLGGGTGTTGNPTPLTVGTLANEMAGTGIGTGSPPPTASGVGSVARPAATDAYGRPALTGDYATNLAGINTIAQRGLANLGQGALENLSPGELGTFKSGLAYLGRSADDELAAYKRSRPGQGSATAA